MTGRVLYTEKFCPDCPIGMLFCGDCEFRHEVACDPDHVYCSHEKADKRMPAFDTDTRKGLPPRGKQFVVLVQEGDPLWHAMLEAHPVIKLFPRGKKSKKRL